MRIGLVAPPWLPVPPPKYGGTEAVVDRLARGFVARGHEVVLFCTGDSTCPVPTAWVYENARRSELGQVVVELRHV
ncbi:MAG TPA: glycosyltransferase, partial [Acidothermaceae bacterium]